MCKDEEEKQSETIQCSQCKRELSLIFFINNKQKVMGRCSICQGKKECEYCNEKAHYNFPKGEIPRFCETHKEDDMVVVTGNLCHTNGCDKRATFNYEGKVRGVFCKKHKEDKMIDVKHMQCEYSSCILRPIFNFEGKTRGRFCYDHKENGMVNVLSKKCEYEGCKKNPTYNFENEIKARFCYDHKENGMVNVVSKKCEYEGCKTLPNYNFEGQSSARFCDDHKENGMIDVKSPQCEYAGCITRPIFNFEGNTKLRFCFDHKEDGMIDIKSKKCEYNGCKTHPSYNFEGQSTSKFCYDHKEDGMVNIVSKKCEYNGCKTLPNYNFKGHTTGRFCVDHKQDNMVNVKSPRCEYIGCTKQPSYNFEGLKKGRYCFDHKEDNMINIISKRCELCSKIPVFNFEGETKGKYCDEHKKDGMVNVIDKKCEFQGCEIRANFNLETESTGRFCFDHKKDGMINVKDKHRLCKHPDCSSVSSYGYCSQPATYCAKHYLPRMFKKPKRTCIAEKCTEIATYGINEPTHCETHIEKDEICLLEAKCKQCNQVDLLTKEGLCITICSPCELYNKLKSHQKTKEISMLAYLDNECKDIESDYKIADDRVIDKQCNAYRPDRLIDCGTHMVIIECDEFQHKNKEVCEKYRNLRHMEDCRMYAIQQACGGVPCVFLRWNPDAFRINDTVCKKYPVNKRHQILAKWLRHCVALEVTKEQPPMYIELFYDGYKEGNTSFTTITEQDIV
jgi:hypothetical protein